MLGNFSFGDYFKKDAIAFAWDLMTEPSGIGLDRTASGPPSSPTTTRRRSSGRPYAAEGPDPPLRREGQLLVDGRDGPLRALQRDFTTTGADRRTRRRTAPSSSTATATRRWSCGTSSSCSSTATRRASMTPLPKPSVDTGAGLERITAILQGANNNYDTDLFQPIIAKIEELDGSGVRSAAWPSRTLPSASSRTTRARRRC